MKKLHSKKGLTLVELVVTVAILSIVAGMGTGIVAQVIRNYATAEITSTEQSTALDVESFLLKAAHVASSAAKVDTIDNDKTVYCLSLYSNGNLQTVRSEIETLGTPPMVTTLTYTGVNSVSVQVKKQKPEKENADPSLCFIFMEYSIEMAQGYVLQGSVVLNNADMDYPMKVASPPTYVDEADKLTISRDTAATNKIIAIYK